MVKRPKTSPFHGGNPGSNPGGVTKIKKHALRVFFILDLLGIECGEENKATPKWFGGDDLLLGFQIYFFLLSLSVVVIEFFPASSQRMC